MVLRMALRMGELGPERERVAVRLAGPPPQRMTPARRRVLVALADGLLRTKSEAAKDAGVSTGVIDGLVDEGTLEVVPLPPQPVARQPDPDSPHARADRLAAHGRRHFARRGAEQGGFMVDLLDGVTGSGKTEVYFEAIAETIRQRPPVAGPVARDRAHGAIPRSLRGSASARVRPNGIRSSARAGVRVPGARSRPAK